MWFMDVVEVLSDLVSVDTSSPGEGYNKIVEMITGYLKDLGVDYRVIDGNAPDGKRRPNVLGEVNTDSDKTLLIAAHYDVVPPGDGWDTPPFKLTEIDDRLYGRGASDDKAAIAILLSALDETDPRVNLKILFTCDEEVGGRYGLGYVTENHPDLLKSDLAWIMDAGTEMISIGCSGVVDGWLRVFGKGSHAGYPHMSDNPIPKLARVIDRLKEFQTMREGKRSVARSPPGSPYDHVWGRFNITVLRSGEKPNMIPEYADAGFDLRLLPEESVDEGLGELKEYLDRVMDELGYSYEIRDVIGHEGYLTRETPDISRFAGIVSSVLDKDIPVGAELGGTDGPFINRLGIPTIGFGPIDPDTRFHQPNEFVGKETLNKMICVTSKVITEL